MKLSVVVPVYNDEETLVELTERLKLVIEKLQEERKISLAEIIYVDDGSKDKSWEIIKNISQKEKIVKGIKLSRNFGHHHAILAGFDKSSGDVVVLMDSDLQDKPEDIPELLAKLNEGYDIVGAKRKKRKDPLWVKLGSKLFYFLFNKIAGIKVPEEVGSFAIFTRKVVNEFCKHRERARLHIGLVAYLGFKMGVVEVEQKESKRSFTNYPFLKRLKLALMGMISFSKALLRFSTILGFFFSALAFSIGGYYLIRKLFFSIPVPGYASLIVAITFFSSVQLLILGILGEYIGVIMEEVKGRAVYIIEEETDE